MGHFSNVVMFVPVPSEATKGLLETMGQTVGSDRLDVVGSTGELRERLRLLPEGTSVIVLVAASEVELASLASMAPLLNNARLVLALPDSDEATVAKGHNLRPRVIGSGPEFLRQIPAIVAKMLSGPP